MRIVAVIPARFGASRFPGKPLAEIAGKPMVQHVWEAARRADGIDRVVVATDDKRIADAVARFGGEAVMTRPDQPTGTDRIAEVAESDDADAFINVQGDEPLIDPGGIALVARMLREREEVEIATLCAPISPAEAGDPNRVKVVFDDEGRAHYFSRSLIPYPRDPAAARYFQHIGIYGYRREVLLKFPSLPRPLVERAESLEQLRLLAAGHAIHVGEVAAPSIGVDTPADLERAARLLAGTAPVPAIRLLIADIDGVMTDGGLYYGPEGETIKRFDVRDGLGIKRLQQAGIRVAAISGRDCAALRIRLEELGVELPDLGVEDKGAFARDLIARHGLSREEVAAIGDDLPDLAVFDQVGTSFAPADAAAEILAAATYRLTRRGGRGAAREACDIILERHVGR